MLTKDYEQHILIPWVDDLIRERADKQDSYSLQVCDLDLPTLVEYTTIYVKARGTASCHILDDFLAYRLQHVQAEDNHARRYCA